MLKSKSDTLKAFEKFIADISPYGNLKYVRTDEGTEFTSGAFESVLIKNKINHQKTSPYSPHKNGTIERAWHTIFEIARRILKETNLPKYMWSYVIMSSTYIRNRFYNNQIGKTPYEIFTGAKPKLLHIHRFGSICNAHVQNPKKLDDRGEKEIFVGYNKYSPAYLVYFPEKEIVRTVRTVEFRDKFSEYPNRSTSTIHESHEDSVTKDEEINTQISKPTLKVTENSQRTKTRPIHFRDYFINDEVNDILNHTKDYCYYIKFIPKTYNEAIQSEESIKWKLEKEEMDILKENQTFELMQLP